MEMGFTSFIYIFEIFWPLQEVATLSAVAEVSEAETFKDFYFGCTSIIVYSFGRK